MSARQEVIHSRIWEEEPEPDNPFSARACYCAGYDVYGDLLGKIGWIEYLYLLFRLEPPSQQQTRLLEGLAVALANPGPRDPSVRAAMCGGVGGSGAAACLMAALAPGAGNLGGAREVYVALQWWSEIGTSVEQWRERIVEPPVAGDADVWPDLEHIPGFDPYGSSCARPVIQALNHLADVAQTGPLDWLRTHRRVLEEAASRPLAMSAVAACTLHHLGFAPDQGEMLYLLLRLPGAAAHALEQKGYGWRRYPFFGEGLHLAADADPRTADSKPE